jgi:hypothetical protein
MLFEQVPEFAVLHAAIRRGVRDIMCPILVTCLETRMKNYQDPL